MLIQDAIDLLTPSLTALPWVEFFGGVTQRVSIPQSDGNGGTIYKNIPVSCSFTASDCNVAQRYQALTPNSSKKSVLYWEVTQGLTDQGSKDGQRQKRILTGSARLVGWLNTNKLGINECNTAADAMRSLLPLMYARVDGFAPGSPFYNSKVVFEFAGEDIKDSNIFGAYDYGNNKDGFLLHPYDYFAIRVNIAVTLSLCDYSFTPDTPIECIDNSALPNGN